MTDDFDIPSFLSWVGYFADTEEFDRTLPGGWSPRGANLWIPLDRAPSSRFASKRRKKVFARKSRIEKSRACEFVEEVMTPGVTAAIVLGMAEVEYEPRS